MNQTLRLAAFTLIFGTLSTGAAVGQEMRASSLQAIRNSSDVMYGYWGYSKTLDPMTDEDTSSLMTASLGEENIGMLSFNCMGSGLHVAYGWNRFFGGDSHDEVLVQFRIDSEPADEQRYWGLLINTRDGALMPGNVVQDFARRVASGGKVYFRVVDPLDGDSEQHLFSLTGVARGLEQLSCAQ